MSNMRQIARLAGVSLSTVFRALNDSSRISPSTREKIQDIARQLNYTPPGQQTGRFSNGRVIGYLIHQRFGPIATDTLRGAMEEAWRHQFGITMMQVSASQEWIEEGINNLLGMGISGLILSHAYQHALPHRIVMSLRSHGIHVVQILIKLFTEPLDSVCRHEEEYARVAAEYLAALGHRRILGVSIPAEPWTQIFRERGMSISYLSYPQNAPEEMLQAFTAFINMAPRPTAVIVATVEFAYRLMNLLQQHGVRVPEDVSLIAIGDWFESERFPEITTIDIQALEMGRLGVRLLAERMVSGVPPHEITDFHDIVLPAHVIERGSTRIKGLDG